MKVKFSGLLFLYDIFKINIYSVFYLVVICSFGLMLMSLVYRISAIFSAKVYVSVTDTLKSITSVGKNVNSASI